MGELLKLFVLAGEPSGDRIGADLIRRLRQKTALRLAGVGGIEMIGEGLTPLFPMDDLSVMGFGDVLGRLPLLLWRIEQAKRSILATRPDVVVLIDSQVFSALLARRLRAAGFRDPVLLYVAPSVWARAPERAGKLRPLFDEVMTVLPFEPAVLTRLGGPPATYVGHPALTEPRGHAANTRPLIALLPGSREGELRRHLPLMARVAKAVGPYRFVVPTLPNLADRIRAEVSSWRVDVEVEADRSRRSELYARTCVALTVAGTATLELALAEVPMIVTYVMEKVQARHFEQLGRPRVGLPNIILGEDLTPELIQPSPDPVPLIAGARQLLSEPHMRARQAAGFRKIRTMMEQGTPEAPRQDPADRVLAHWQAQKGEDRQTSP